MSLRYLRNTKGQVAIFVVLLFQVLFILFAMTINIAMVTYDKINLQNSLDLAVYYGAKKQAEVLNAMAHINYQMRQNWKLLAWRYRIMGTLAQYYGWSDPYYWCPQNSEADPLNTPGTPPVYNKCKSTATSGACSLAQSIFSSAQVYGSNYCDRFYFVCISHDLWRRGISDSGQNLCTKEGVSIPSVVDLPMVADFLPSARLAAGGVDQLQEEIGESCPLEGALNWLMTQFFVTHFRLDQKDRKVMMQEIYNKTLKGGKDLDGKSIFKGSAKVFCKNLSYANQRSLESFCNSYPAGAELTAFNSFQDKEFKDIFKKLNVWPVLQFIFDDTKDSSCNVSVGSHLQNKPLIATISGGSIFANVRAILAQPQRPHSLASSLTSAVGKLFAFNRKDNMPRQHEDPMRDQTLSFFKKKDQILYYGLKVEFAYQSDHQVFSLNLSDPIKFKASAFAKPFGASFGPQPEQNDPLVPVHHPDAPSPIPLNTNQMKPALLQPNHSRFPGDKWGLIDRRLHDNSQPMNFLNKHKWWNRAGTQTTRRVYSMEDYFHLTLWQGKADDPLARREFPGQPNNPFYFTRMMELIAVYPDLYDVSYYSILGNYHQTYFKKICLLLKGSDCNTNARNPFPSTASNGKTVYIRGDFGWPDTEKYIEKNKSRFGSQKTELSVAPYFLKSDRSDVALPPDTGNVVATLWGNNWPFRSTPPHRLSQGNWFDYKWLANPLPDRLLSSWTNPNPIDYKEYKFPDDRFMECEGEALEKMPVPSACAQGGRSGYSVKLISCETVKAFTNNQPSNIDEYCP